MYLQQGKKHEMLWGEYENKGKQLKLVISVLMLGIRHLPGLHCICKTYLASMP